MDNNLTNSNGNAGQEQDPLAQFTQGNEQQGAANGVVMFGRQWNSAAEAEQWAAQEFAKQQQEVARLQGMAQAAPSQQHSAQQYETGAEPTGYDRVEALRLFAERPDEGLDYMLKAKLFGNAKIPGSAIDLLKNTMLSAATTQRRLEEMELRNAHPEINWQDPNQIKTLSEIRQRYNLPANQAGLEGAIGIAQANGMLPTQAQYYQWRAQQAQQQPNGYQTTGQQQPTSGTQQYGNGWQVHNGANVTAPPMMGRPNGGGGPQIDFEAVLEKMNDPATPLDEVNRLRASLEKYVQRQAVG